MIFLLVAIWRLVLYVPFRLIRRFCLGDWAGGSLSFVRPVVATERHGRKTFAVIKAGNWKVAPRITHSDRFGHLSTGDEDRRFIIGDNGFGRLEHADRE